MLSERSGFTRRGLLGMVAAGVSLLPKLAHADPWASEALPATVWVKTTMPDVSVRVGPDSRADRLRLIRSGTALRILDSVDNWKQVFDPHADATGYVRADLLEPADAPAGYAFMNDPPVDAELSTIAIATTDLPLHFYPNHDPLAQATTLDAGDRETIVGTIDDADGTTWFKTDDGYYIPSDGLFIGATPQEFGGRWLDVSLSGAAHVVAYDQSDTVRAFYAIKGTAKYPTPPGTWSIVRRVANETMDSTTVGIPRNSPGGYYLKNVLYTQYFRGTGESLHYNWWSSAWGLPGSHGCLGLSLADSRWLWDWAAIGTPVSIHA
ncbi:MAG: L,D-transpeptidase family protein [Chloroflexi bacterium]|nr:L,D-transpeptidase family protein [Chloroflexota bacterium]